MMLEKILRKDKLYYHCAWHGAIFEDSNYSIFLLQVKRDELGRFPLTKEYHAYEITSGICPNCLALHYEVAKENYKKKS